MFLHRKGFLKSTQGRITKGILKMITSRYKKLAVYTGFFFSAFILTGGYVAASENVRIDIACPSTNFHQFIKVFLNDANVQRKFTEFPLKKVQFDFANRSEAKRVILLLKENDILFPVIPLEKEKEEKDREIMKFSTDTSGVSNEFLPNLLKPSYDAGHQEVIAIISGARQIFYTFQKKKNLLAFGFA